MVKRFSFVCFSAVLALGLVLFDCAAGAVTLTDVIGAAKKEGTVSAKLRSGVTEKALERMEREIKSSFGVDLKIKSMHSSNQPQDMSIAITEYKAGAIPSYDLMTFAAGNSVMGLQAGIFEQVDWSSLIPKETSPEVLVKSPPFGVIGLSYYTDQRVLVYNTTKIPQNRVPKTLNDLADPKWKGMLGIHNYSDGWSERAFALGKDKVLSTLRVILNNGAIQGSYVDLYNRYLIGEISLAWVSYPYYIMALNKGVPSAVQNIDYIEDKKRPLLVRKGAPHPNAAKLLAIYLSSPQGAKLMLEETGAGNAWYPALFPKEVRAKDMEQGMQMIKDDDFLNFYKSNDFEKWMKEIDLIFKTTSIR